MSRGSHGLFCAYYHHGFFADPYVKVVWGSQSAPSVQRTLLTAKLSRTCRSLLLCSNLSYKCCAMVKAVCDVCEHAEGSVYCFQESAVMCRDCDHRCCQHPWVVVFLKAFGPVCVDQDSRRPQGLVKLGTHHNDLHSFAECTAPARWPEPMSASASQTRTRHLCVTSAR